MKSMQEIERRLMAEFTVEVMTGNSIDVQELPGYNDDFNDIDDYETSEEY